MTDLKSASRDVLDMEIFGGDDGQIVYTSKKPRLLWRGVFGAWLIRLAGIALGICFFLLIIFLFVYVVVPLIVILSVIFLVRGLLTRR